LVQNVLYFSLL